MFRLFFKNNCKNCPALGDPPTDLRQSPLPFRIPGYATGSTYKFSRQDAPGMVYLVVFKSQEDRITLTTIPCPFLTKSYPGLFFTLKNANCKASEIVYGINSLIKKYTTVIKTLL